MQYVQPVLVQPEAAAAPKKQVSFDKMTVDEKLEATQKDVDTTVKRLKCCGLMFGITGIFFLGNSAYSLKMSADYSYYISQTGKLPFVANQTELDAVLADKYEGANQHTFALYDVFAKIAACTFLLAVVLIGFACRNRHAVKAMHTRAARGSFRRGVVAFIVFMFAYVVSKRQCADMKNIMADIADEKNATTEVNATMETVTARRELSFYRHHRKSHDSVFNDLEQFVEKIFESDQERQGLPANFEEGMDARDFVDQMDMQEQEQEAQVPEPSFLEQYFTRERAYRMFAPKLWKFAKRDDEPRHPTVAAAKDDDKKKPEKIDWPKPTGTCPVILFLLISILSNLFLLKSLEKQLANVQLYQLTKQLLEKKEDESANRSMYFEYTLEEPSTTVETISTSNSMA